MALLRCRAGRGVQAGATLPAMPGEWGEHTLKRTCVGGGDESDGTASDSTDSAGRRMGMPHRDHILYADLLQGYNDSDGEVSCPSTKVSDDKRYMSGKRARRVLGS